MAIGKRGKEVERKRNRQSADFVRRKIENSRNASNERVRRHKQSGKSNIPVPRGRRRGREISLWPRSDEPPVCKSAKNTSIGNKQQQGSNNVSNSFLPPINAPFTAQRLRADNRVVYQCVSIQLHKIHLSAVTATLNRIQPKHSQTISQRASSLHR